MPEGNDYMTTTELAAVIPEIWSSNYYPTLLAATPFLESVAKDYDSEISALGDIVHASNFPEFSAAQKIAENEAAVAQSNTPTNINLTVNTQVVLDYIITLRAGKQSLSVVQELTNLAMYAIEKKWQSEIISAVVPSASSPDHQISYDSGSTLALADCLEAKELLDDANVPKDNRVMITDAAQSNDLFNVTGFTSRDFIPSGSPMTAGDFATPILGFTHRETTEASAVTYCFRPEFMQIAFQQKPEVEVFNMGGQGIRAMRTNSSTLGGIKQFSDVRVVSIS